MERIAVIGSGTMGHGIAQVAAMNGLRVGLYDIEEGRLVAALGQVRSSLDRLARSGKLDETGTAEALGRIETTTELASAVDGAEVVIEAVPEVLELKHQVFRQLDATCPAETVLATNTSQLSITEIAAVTAYPERTLGLHFFNPPVLMRLVEVVRGLRTSDVTLGRGLELVGQLGKESVVCQRDAAGFITTRALAALRLECLRIYEEGIASIADIDKAIRLGLNHPMGPFELTDLVGLDVALNNSRNLEQVYGERFRPPQSLALHVAAGRLGRKTGAGWYDYSPEGERVDDSEG